jgi:exopolyphosphatase/guanosine-5'-triphosphate,3'-diphosphate pyrophosphatase
MSISSLSAREKAAFFLLLNYTMKRPGEKEASGNRNQGTEIANRLLLIANRSSPVKVGFIDIGTNSVRYLAAEIPDRGEPAVIARGLSTPRLGEGLAAAGKLKPEAIRRTLEALAAVRDKLREEGVTSFDCVGTEALRSARNADDFLRGAENLGLTLEILSGEEEAGLILRGALTDLPLPSPNGVLADIGGGSTEIIVRRRGKSPSLLSLPLGCVRLREIFGGEDEVSRTKIREFCRGKLAEASVPESGSPLIGLGGTFTTLAAIERQLEVYRGEIVHGTRLSRRRMEEIRGMLCALPLDERKKVVGLEPLRADIIIPGIAIAEALMDRLGAAEATVSDRGILYGILSRRADRVRCGRLSPRRSRP